MRPLIFVTGNKTKYRLAEDIASRHGVRLIQKVVEIDEIQSENPEKIIRDKAFKAFGSIGKPVVVSDDSWAFLGLKGFPGPYMHSINRWFTPNDFLRLTLLLTDRRAVLTQMIVYQDGNTQKLFASKTTGELLKEVRGHSVHPNHTIVTMPGDNGLSLAEVYGGSAPLAENRQVSQIWREFFEWYSQQP